MPSPIVNFTAFGKFEGRISKSVVSMNVPLDSEFWKLFQCHFELEDLSGDRESSDATTFSEKYWHWVCFEAALLLQGRWKFWIQLQPFNEYQILRWSNSRFLHVSQIFKGGKSFLLLYTARFIFPAFFDRFYSNCVILLAASSRHHATRLWRCRTLVLDTTGHDHPYLPWRVAKFACKGLTSVLEGRAYI